MQQKNTRTDEQVFQKLRLYCSYQERCHAEVRDKLFSLKVSKNLAEQIISQLIVKGYLNEERFAVAFAGGKFRIKHWGKVKIRYELKQKKVSDHCINKALCEIDETDYLKKLGKLVNEKLKKVKPDGDIYERKRKVIDFMLQKGYERNLVLSFLSNTLK